MINVKSPLDSSANCTLVKTIPVKEIIEKYNRIYKIDVEIFFKGLNEISIYECENTKYKFYYPLNTDGNSQFYEHLQEGDFYYVPWKWEHEAALKYINNGDNILEVGSGGNGFVRAMTNKGYNITGLELNVQSVKNGLVEGLKIYSDTIQDYSVKHPGEYDVVCSFQVLEHIAEPFSLLESKVRSLKPGGKMIICVPNNDSFFLKYNDNPPLNMPPHHMGLWHKESLSALSKLFDLKILAIEYEYLQHYHVKGFSSLIFIKWIPNRYVRYIFRKLMFDKCIEFVVGLFKEKIQGHSIMIVFQK